MANTPIFADPFPTGSCLERVLNGVAVGGIAGTVSGIGQAFWQRPQEFGGVAASTVSYGDTIPTFARFGKHITVAGGLMAACGAAFAIGDCTAETLRGTRDPLNGFFGGAAMGMVAGIKYNKARVMGGMALGCGIVGAGLHAAGGTLSQTPEAHAARVHGLRKPLESK